MLNDGRRPHRLGVVLVGTGVVAAVFEFAGLVDLVDRRGAAGIGFGEQPRFLYNLFGEDPPHIIAQRLARARDLTGFE